MAPIALAKTRFRDSDTGHEVESLSQLRAWTSI